MRWRVPITAKAVAPVTAALLRKERLETSARLASQGKDVSFVARMTWFSCLSSGKVIRCCLDCSEFGDVDFPCCVEYALEADTDLPATSFFLGLALMELDLGSQYRPGCLLKVDAELVPRLLSGDYFHAR